MEREAVGTARVRRLLWSVLLLCAACAVPAGSAAPLEQANVRPGTYRFESVNGVRLPVESPVADGVLLEAGTLDLEPDGRYVRFFLVRPRFSPDVATSLQEGTYRADGGTLLLTPSDARGGRPTRYGIEQEGDVIVLHDEYGNVWTYQRVESAIR